MANQVRVNIFGSAQLQEWIAAQTQLEKLTSAADDFLGTLKLGIGIDLGGRLVSGISQLPGLLQQAVGEGVNYLTFLENTKQGIAAILRTFDGERIGDFNAALQETDKIIAKIRAQSESSSLSFTQILEAYQANVGNLFAAGIRDADEQIRLIDLLAKGAKQLTGDAFQAKQEIRALLTGNIGPDAQAAVARGITKADIDAAKEAGNVYEFLTQKFAEFGNIGGDSFDTVRSNFDQIVLDAKGLVAEGTFEVLKTAAEELGAALKDPAVQQALRQLGVDLAELVKQGAGLARWAIENSGLLITMAQAVAVLGGAFTALKIVNITAGLVAKAAAWGAVTTAVTANTAAVTANTAANTANSAAAGASAGAAAGGAFASRFSAAIAAVNWAALGIGIGLAIGGAVAQGMRRTMERDLARAESGEDLTGLDGSDESIKRLQTAIDQKREEIAKRREALKREEESFAVSVLEKIGLGPLARNSPGVGKDAPDSIENQKANIVVAETTLKKLELELRRAEIAQRRRALAEDEAAKADAYSANRYLLPGGGDFANSPLSPGGDADSAGQAFEQAQRTAAAREAFAFELAIARAKADGNTALAEALEREVQIREKAREIADEQGRAADEARRLAEELAAVENKGALAAVAVKDAYKARLGSLRFSGLEAFDRLQDRRGNRGGGGGAFDPPEQPDGFQVSTPADEQSAREAAAVAAEIRRLRGELAKFGEKTVAALKDARDAATGAADDAAAALAQIDTRRADD